MIAQSRSARNTNGFSIIELLVASTIFLFLVMGLMAMLIQNTKISEAQQAISDLQQRTRIALNYVAARVRRAGFQVPSGAVIAAALDTITLRGTIQDLPRLRILITEGADLIHVRKPSGLLATDTAYTFTLYDFNDHTVSTTYTILSIADGTFGGSDTTVIQVDAPIFAAAEYDIGLANDTIDFALNANILRQRVNGGAWQPIAEDITALTFEYTDIFGTEYITAAEIAGLNVADIALVKATLTGTTKEEIPVGVNYAFRTFTAERQVQVKNLVYREN